MCCKQRTSNVHDLLGLLEKLVQVFVLLTYVSSPSSRSSRAALSQGEAPEMDCLPFHWPCRPAMNANPNGEMVKAPDAGSLRPDSLPTDRYHSVYAGPLLF
jgi:hypothetical protein